MGRWHSYYIILFFSFFFSLIFSHFSNEYKLGEEQNEGSGHRMV